MIYQMIGLIMLKRNSVLYLEKLKKVKIIENVWIYERKIVKTFIN